MAFKHPPLPPDDAPFDDPDNPEWTDETFAAALGPESLPPAARDAFPKTRRHGRPPQEVTKTPIKLRLDPDVVERFKADGPGWQSRMNEALRKAVGL